MDVRFAADGLGVVKAVQSIFGGFTIGRRKERCLLVKLRVDLMNAELGPEHSTMVCRGVAVLPFRDRIVELRDLPERLRVRVLRKQEFVTRWIDCHVRSTPDRRTRVRP